MTDGGRKKGWRRAAACIFFFVLPLLISLGIGTPQEAVTRWAVARYLGGVAEVEWSGTLGSIRIDRFALYPDADARARGEALIEAEGIRVGYRLWPSAGRYLRTVTVRSASVLIDRRDPDTPNYGFLLDRDDANSDRALDPASTPTRVEIERLGCRYLDADGDAEFSGTSARVDFDDVENPILTWRSDSARMTFRSAGRDEESSFEHLVLLFSARMNAKQVEWSQELAWGDDLSSKTSGRVDLRGDDPEIEVEVHTLVARDDFLERVAPLMPIPLRCAEVRVDSSTAFLTVGEPLAFGLKGHALVDEPYWMGTSEALYEKTISVDFRAEGDETLSCSATIAFSEGQSLEAWATAAEHYGNVRADLGTWSRDELLAVLPPAFREQVEALSFDAFTGAGEVHWDADRFSVDVHAESSGGDHAAAPIRWAVDMEGSLDGSTAVQGTAEARLGEHVITAEARYTDEDHYEADLSIQRVDIRPWTRFLAGNDLAETVAGTLEGTVHAVAEGVGAPMRITPELTLKEFFFDPVALDQVEVRGVLAYDPEAGVVTIETLRADTVDGLTSAELTDGRYDVEAGSGSGAFAMSADLGIVANLVGLPELFGSGALTGTVEIAGGVLTAPFEMRSDYLGYGDLLLPYGMAFTGTGTFAQDVETGDGTLRGLQASLGEGFHLRSDEIVLTAEPAEARGDISVDSDLQLLVALGWLAEVEGSSSERSQFSITADGLDLDWDLNFRADRLLLSENAGSAEGIVFEGAGRYSEGLSGEGQVRAALLSAAGGSIRDARGSARFENTFMRMKGVQGVLFGGTIVADVDVGVLEEDLPIFVQGSFDGLDLAILSEEVQPPNTKLEGIGEGRLTVDYTMDGLRGFMVDARTTRDFTVNRSLVEDLLSDQLLAGAGERVARKAMNKIMGEQPQRPFDSGHLYVYLTQEVISGIVELKSVKTRAYNGLNLTVNLDMDPGALSEALRLLEESSTTNMEF